MLGRGIILLPYSICQLIFYCNKYWFLGNWRKHKEVNTDTRKMGVVCWGGRLERGLGSGFGRCEHWTQMYTGNTNRVPPSLWRIVTSVLGRPLAPLRWALPCVRRSRRLWSSGAWNLRFYDFSVIILANKLSFGIISMGVTKMVCGSPFAKMSTFWELPAPLEVVCNGK